MLLYLTKLTTDTSVYYIVLFHICGEFDTVSDTVISLSFCQIESDVALTSLDPQGWKSAVPATSLGAGAGVRAGRGPTAALRAPTWGRTRPRDGTCSPGAKAPSCGRGSAGGRTRPPSWT